MYRMKNTLLLLGLALLSFVFATNVHNPVDHNDQSVQISTNANHQITVYYNEDLSEETSVCLYNMVGQKQIS